MRQRILISLIALLAGLGLYLSGGLLADHNGGWSLGDKPYTVATGSCDVDTPTNGVCGSVLRGRFGGFDVTLLGRRIVVPVAYFGVTYFGAWLCLLFTSGSDLIRTRIGRVIVQAFASGGMLVAILLYTLMRSGWAGGWCDRCLMVQLIAFALFIISIWWAIGGRSRVISNGVEEPDAIREPARKTPWPALASSCVLVISFSAGIWFYHQAVSTAQQIYRRHETAKRLLRGVQSDLGIMRAAYCASPRQDTAFKASDLETVEDLPLLEITIFSRFDSGPCRCTVWRLTKLIERMPETKASVTIRHFVPESLDDVARAAALQSDSLRIYDNIAFYGGLLAEASRLNAGESTFRAVSLELFKAGMGVAATLDVKKLARTTNLDVEILLSLMSDDRVVETVRRDTRMAMNAGVDRVPAVFVNGRRVPDICLDSEVFWNALLSGELERGANPVVADRTTLASTFDEFKEECRVDE